MRAAGILLRKSVANQNSSLFKGTMNLGIRDMQRPSMGCCHGCHGTSQKSLQDPCGSLWHVRGLTAGKYYLLCQLPQDVQLVGCQVRTNGNTNGMQMGYKWVDIICHHLTSSDILARSL